MTNKLDRIEAVLVSKREAQHGNGDCGTCIDAGPVDDEVCDACAAASNAYDDLLTDDTIASLVAVARAAAAAGCYTCVGLRDSQSAGWPCNEPAARLHAALAPLLEEATDA